MSDLDITGRVVFDASQAEGALDKIGDKADQMAREVQGAAASAGKSVDKIGDGAAGSAEKFTRAEGRIADSIKRTQTSLELLGKTASEKLEFKINAEGLDAAKFEPALAKLRETEDAALRASTAASGSLNNIGMSAKATENALRSVPAQFTDIVVSLQGGQKPLTVLLQQGGQLKDMFGGVGNAAKALGGYVLGLVNPFTLVAGAAGVAALAYNQGTKEAQEFTKTLVLGGNAIGTTTGNLTDMAKAIDGASFGITQGGAAEALNKIAASGDVGAESLQRFTKIALEFEQTGAGSADAVAKAFSELGNDPLKASEKLNKSTNYLTLEIYNQIKALEDQGQTLDAARVAQEAYASSLESRIPKLADNLGYLDRAWMSIKNSSKEAWDAMLNVGRADTSKVQLQAAFDQIKAIQNQSGFTITDEVRQIKINQQLEVIKGLEKEAIAQANAAAAEKKRFESTQAGIALSKNAVQYETDLDKQRRKVLEATTQYEAALKGVNLTQAERNQLEKDYLQTVSGITKVKEEKGTGERDRKKAIKDANRELAEQSKLLAELAGLSGTFYKDWDRLTALFKAGKLNMGELAAEQSKLLAQQPAIKAARDAEAKSAKEQADTIAVVTKAREDEYKKAAASIVSIEAKAQAIEDEIANYGLTEQAIASLGLARLQEKADILSTFEGSERVVELLNEEIEARKRLAIAQDGIAGKKAATKAAEDAVKASTKAWEKGWEETDKLARDAFTSWATEGGNAAEKIGKSLKTALLSAIYEATIKPIALNLYSSVMGGSPGAAGGAGGGVLSAANNASSLNTAYGAAAQYFTGASVGASGASLVAANAAGALGGDALGTLIAANGSWAGVAVGAEAAAGTAAASGAAAGASAGVTAGLAAIPVWGWVALAALAVVGLSDGPTSTRSTGYANRKYGADGKLLSSATDGNGIGEAGGVLDGIYKSIAGVQASLGAKGGADITYNSNTGRESKDPQFYLKTGSYDSGEIAKNDANVSLAISRTILTAIQDSELPKYLQGAFDGMVAGSMSQEQINAAIQGGQALKTFNDQLLALPFANLADLSFSATQNLIGFSGGLEKLGANLGAYYTNFYNAEEQRAQTVKNINAATAGSGLDAATATREQFRSIVESQDLATESGQRMYAALLGVSAAFAGITPAAMDASQAINDAAKAAADKYANDQATLRLSMERKLLELQGDSAAIRLLEIKGMDDANVALFDRIDALAKEQAAAQESTTAAKELATAAKEAAQALASANQGIRDRIDVITGAQTDRTLTLRDTPDVSTRTLLSELYNTEDLKAANDAVTAAENTLADARRASADIAADAAQRSIEQALDAKRALAEASRSAAQDLTKELQAVFDTLQSSVRDLYRDVLSTAAMGAVAGQQFIDSALANARASGYLPDNKALGDAISAARGGMGDNQYATVFDRDRDRLVLAGKLSELARIAEPQLSAAEQALQLAKSQLDELADQTNLARKLADKVDAVPAALQKLQDALIAQTQAQTATLAASLVAAVATGSTKPQDAIKQFEDKTGVGVARDSWINAGGTQVYASAGGAIAVGGSAASGVVPTDPRSAAIYGTQGQQTTVGDAQAFIAQALAKGDGKSIYDAAVAYGISSAAVDALGGFAPGSAAAWAAEHKLPAFAVGTNYVPSDMVAQIHEGEAIVPKAYNPAANPGMGTGNTERLERLVEGLTAEVQRLQSIVSAGNENTRQLADQFDNVTEGGNATRTVAV